MNKSIVIIGGGIAGLCTGCYAAAHGYRVTIYEKNGVPGGLCTAWKRDGYTIDGCLHFLTGAFGEDTDLFKAWKFLGVIGTFTYVSPDEFMRVEGENGVILSFTRDLDKLEADMCAIAPEDEEEIIQFIKTVKRFARSRFGLQQPTTLWQRMQQLCQIIPLLPTFKKYGPLSLGDFSKRFKNPFLADVFAAVWDSRMSALALFFMLAWHKIGVFGYPIGGSAPFAGAIEKRFLELGGKIEYNAAVAKIITRDDQAVGIALKDGTSVEADYVISAADGHQTLYTFLEGKYVSPKVASYFKELPIFGPIIMVAFGVNRTFSEFPTQHSCTIYHIPTTRIADREHSWLQVKIYNQDPTLAPQGKTVVTVLLDSDYDYWEKLSHNSDDYRAAKEVATQTVIQLLERVIPGIAADIEMHDVSTPVSFERYTNNWKGSYEGWLPTPKTAAMRMDKTVPGLQNFYMVGHWVYPGGGLPSGVMTAQAAVKMLCKRDKRK